MRPVHLVKSKLWIVISLYFIALMVFSLWIRVLPLVHLGNSDIFGIVDVTDSLYLLRQIEQTVPNFPAYGYYDPMTYYPHGQTIGIGPLFIWICSGLCLAIGATTRPEIAHAALLVPPVMAVLMIPVIFLLTRNVADWKAGLVGAGLAAVIGGNYFHVSLAGHLDHHMADIVFSTVFCLSYLYTVSYASDHHTALRQPDTARMLVALSLLSGITFSMGLLTMPTMILFGLLLVLFTLAMLFYDLYHNRGSEYLLVINLIVFGCAVGTLLINGIQSPGTNLHEYSIGQPIAYLLAGAGTVLLYALVRAARGSTNRGYLALVLCIGIAGLLAVVLLVPEIVASLVAGYNLFFGFNPLARVVQETQTWSPALGWRSFGFGLVLAAGGYGILVWRSLKQYQPFLVFVLVWSLLMALATWRQSRNEYYLAVPIVILSALCIVWFSERGWNALTAMVKRVGGSGAESVDRTPILRQFIPPVHIVLGILVVIMGVFFVLSSVQFEYRVASSQANNGVDAEWRDALEWLRTSTPETGVDYYTVYDRATFTYPEQSYGVLTWWDRGNMITFFASRIPSANSFQSGAGESAGFFMANSEKSANRIAETGGMRYIVTDIRMAEADLRNIAMIHNSSEGLLPYKEPFLIPGATAGERSETATFYKKPFFNLTLIRLHFFDGSMLRPTNVLDIEYDPPTVSTRGLKVLQSVTSRDAADGRPAEAPEAGKIPRGKRADTVSSSHLLPIETVPALQHYRLVYESPRNLSANGTEKYIKIFEHVPGARIPGDGVIEVSLVTNGGRQFAYRQASTNGAFTVPYSTTGNPYNVSAVGRYRILGTGMEVDVSEDAVRKGLGTNT